MEKRKHRNRNEQRELLLAWQKSEESARAFGKRHGVSESTLWNWQSREKRSAKTAFVEVKVRDKLVSGKESGYELVLKNGRRLLFCAQADREEVCEWADALDASC